MNILIVGTGGVGGYFGGLLAKAGEDVSFLARGKHGQAIRKNGLHVKSIDGDFQVKVNVFEKPPKGKIFHLILICVKAYQTEQVLPVIQSCIHKETTLISLQNGIGRHEILRAQFPKAHVLGGHCNVGSFVEEPGVIRHVAGGAVVIGEISGTTSPIIDEIQKRFQKAGMDIAVSKDIVLSQWQKLMWNLGFNGPTAILDMNVGEILKRDEQRTLIRSLIHEGMEVAKANQFLLPQDLAEKMMARSEKYLAAVETSMARDRRLGRPLELDIFYQFIMEEGRRHQIPTPANALVYRILSAFQIS